MEVIRNFTLNGQKKTIVTNRIHHVIGDGIGLVTIMFSLLEKETPEQAVGPDDSTTKVMRKEAPNPYLTYLLVALQGPWIVARVLASAADYNPFHKYELSGKRHVALSPRYDIADVKAIKKHYRVTVNDALMGILGAAINRYFAQEGDTKTKQIQLYVPVNMRTSSKPARLENKFSPANVPLPVFTPDPEKSIFAAREVFVGMKKSVSPLVMYLVGALLGSMYVPRWLGSATFEFTSSKATAVVTNVPGPQEIMKFAGQRMESTMFWVPARGYVGVGISLLSYGGGMQVGITADEMCLKDPARLAKCFDEVFAEVKEKVCEKEAKAA
eukprot:comp19558_c0_seq2/m.22947 comp19558_c0_seq2/g.22947  ORF comp19558_c0_seq2/g.22947 comp19558_c0_seq2/m.22947 type:complete len:327 (-) comp19558_c0_seq2:708-1688(-)